MNFEEEVRRSRSSRTFRTRSRMESYVPRIEMKTASPESYERSLRGEQRPAIGCRQRSHGEVVPGVSTEIDRDVAGGNSISRN
jgi:hypothetical protein